MKGLVYIALTILLIMLIYIMLAEMEVSTNNTGMVFCERNGGYVVYTQMTKYIAVYYQNDNDISRREAKTKNAKI